MRVIGVLLKKDLTERFSNFKGKKKDIGGLLLSLVLTLLLVGVFVAVLSFFAKTYVSVKIGYFSNEKERLYEVLTLFYSLLFLLLILVGIAKLNKNLIEVSNVTMLSMPITPFQIYISKMVGVYIDLFLTTILLSAPICIVFIFWNMVKWPVIFFAVLFSIILPFLALCVSSIFTVPYFYLKRWLNKHFVVQLIAYVIIIAIAFVLYSMFLKIVKGLIESGRITFIFDETTVNLISKICKFLLPANFIAGIIVGEKVGLNILFILISLLVSLILSFFVSQSIFSLVRQNRIGKKDDVFVKSKIRKPRSITSALLSKEFVNVLRTPSYAFNYFAVILTLPLMVVVTTSLLSSMMTELILINCDFEIVLCSVCMYSILLNSFCANNISRDGKFFNLIKTFPISGRRIVFTKILFCMITIIGSLFITAVAVFVAGYLDILKILAILGVSLILNVGVICLATRKDLNTANNVEDQDNKTSTNFLIFWGIILSVIITVISLVLSIYLQMEYSVKFASLATCLVVFVVSLIIFALSLVYLLKNLDKKFKELVI